MYKKQDIQIYLDNEVSTVSNIEEKYMLDITLESGKGILVNAIVYAIGTRPNISLYFERDKLPIFKILDT